MIATIKGATTAAGAIYHNQYPHSSHSQLKATSIDIPPPLGLATTDNLQHTAYDANSGSATTSASSASSMITIIHATTAVVVPHQQQQPQLHKHND
jgi:hypothetical protein